MWSWFALLGKPVVAPIANHIGTGRMRAGRASEDMGGVIKPRLVGRSENTETCGGAPASPG